ncbi:hypothetical protein SGRA_1222 [Saprospira grandis str. Lewin]|uniref:Uncharacterized protein n=1 Tax=Saprospira grandis (strain Lewin) TaxID=984262 RepID=H6L4N3_SAPGL|nr:hypothetical protein SGRA_1222 [Saprospira grandis str. Lewin]
MIRGPFLDLFSFLGLPRPAGGSGCVGARRSARPCAGFARWVCGFAAPLSIPQPRRSAPLAQA